MWDDFGLGYQGMAMQSFMTGHTYLIPSPHGNRVCLGGMDVTDCDWLFEQNPSNKSDVAG